jgi:hypothetical protein
LNPMISVNTGCTCGMALRQRLNATKLLPVLPSGLGRSPGVAAFRAAGGVIGTLLSFCDLLKTGPNNPEAPSDQDCHRSGFLYP